MSLWMMRFGNTYTSHVATELGMRESHASSRQATRLPVAERMIVAANEYMQVTSCQGASGADS
jgi:hypothetical protein